MDGVLGLQLVDHHGVTGLVIGGELPGQGGDHPALLLRAGRITNMYEIAETMTGAEKLVKP